VAPTLVGADRARVSRVLPGHRRFWKMTGSGNDFVFFDARTEPAGDLEGPDAIGAICDRRRGVGADGVVFFESDAEEIYGIRYFNRDGSLAEFCGNASLCSVRLAAELGVVQPGQQFRFQTSSGVIPGRMGPQGPEVGMPPVLDANPAFDAALEDGESRIGFARVGVPHLVVACGDVSAVDVERRGRALRHDPGLRAGANVNFVSRRGPDWTYRTYERGVEEETLACGSGSVAAAAMLMAWNVERAPLTLITSSGAPLRISFNGDAPALSGEGRLVFEGTLRDVMSAY
jgi:diaminopimelate epimerase